MKNRINTLNTSIAFTSALIFGVSLSLYAQVAQKDLLIKGKFSKYTNKQIYDISMLSSSILLIVVIYFFFLSLETYKETSSKNDELYLYAAILSLMAQSVRFTVLSNSSPQSEVNPEDVLP